MRFADSMLLMVLGCVVAVVAVSLAVFAWLGVQQLRAAAEGEALSIARTVAEDPEVRATVAAYSAEAAAPTGDELRDGPIAASAAAVESRTGALFVVLTDDRGIRLAHPDPNGLASGSARASPRRSPARRRCRGSGGRSASPRGRRCRSSRPVPCDPSARSASASRPRACSTTCRPCWRASPWRLLLRCRSASWSPCCCAGGSSGSRSASARGAHGPGAAAGGRARRRG